MKKKKNIDLEFMKVVFKKALNNKSNLKLNSKFEGVTGWDSLGHMRIISEIEKQLKVSFEIDEIVGVDTIKKLIDMTKKKIS